MTYFVFFVVIISFMDTFSQLPIISPYAQQLGASSLFIGAIVGMYSFSNMIGNVLSGQWMDRWGRKKIMITGMLLAGSSLILYALVVTPGQLLIVRFFHGIGGGLLIPAVFAYLGDRTVRKRAARNQNARKDNEWPSQKLSAKGKTMALSGAAVGISAIIGPAMGGVVEQFLGIQWVFYLVAVSLIFVAVLAMKFLPESYEARTKQRFQWETWKELLSQRVLLNAYCAAFALMFTLGILAHMLPLQVTSLGLSAATTGLLMSTYGIVAILLFVLPTNRLSDRVGRHLPMLFGLIIIGCSLLGLAFATSVMFMFTAMALYGVGFALLFPAMTASVIDQAHDEDRGKAFGLFYAFFSLGVVTGPLVVGAVDVEPNIAFIIGSGVVWVFSIFLFKRQT